MRKLVGSIIIILIIKSKFYIDYTIIMADVKLTYLNGVYLQYIFYTMCLPSMYYMYTLYSLYSISVFFLLRCMYTILLYELLYGNYIHWAFLCMFSRLNSFLQPV